MIYIVTWKPTSVGGFEWRRNCADAVAVYVDLREQDETVRLHGPVETPTDLQGEALTDWLDAAGWSEGEDPR